MTLDIVNRLLYVVVWGGGIMAFFGHMRFYTVAGLDVLKNILTVIACITPLTLAYALVEWIITGNAKLGFDMLGCGVITSISFLIYYFMCCIISNAHDRENKRII